MTPDRFLHLRGREFPEDYVQGMNCILDSVENEEFRQRVYQRIKGDPTSFSLVASGHSALFVVRSQAFLGAYKQTLEEIHSLAAVDPDESYLDIEIGESEQGFGERLTLKAISFANEAISLLNLGNVEASDVKMRQANEINQLLDKMKISPMLKFGEGGKFLGFDRK